MKIALSSWSLHREIPGKMDLVDFIEVATDEFGISNLELCQQHFSSTDVSYFERVKRKLSDSNSVGVNLPIDVGDISQPDKRKRKEDIAIIKEWIRIAKDIGFPYARVNTGKSSDTSSMQRIIASYKELVEYAESIGIGILIENHGGVSNNPEKLVEIIKKVGSSSFGACPDFGNFPESTRYKDLEMVAPYALLAHAKTYQFDERGEETRINMRQCLDILRRAGYNGYLSIEFEGSGDQFEGVRKSKALLEKYI